MSIGNFKYAIKVAIGEHGENWRDYFSLQQDCGADIEPYQEPFIPGTRNLEYQALLSRNHQEA